MMFLCNFFALTALILSIIAPDALAEYAEFDINSCKMRCGKDPGSVTVGGKVGRKGPRGEKGDKGDSCEYMSQKCSSGCPQTNFLFPRYGQKSDYVRVKSPLPELYELSLCGWIFAGKNKKLQGTIFSYAVDGLDNAMLLLLHDDRTYVTLRDEDKIWAYQPIYDTYENHFCVTMSRTDGYSRLYYNGTLENTFIYEDKNPIPSGGVFLLGQDQDSLFGGFDQSQSFTGKISNFMIWDRILTDDEIKTLSSSKCSCIENPLITLTMDAVQLGGAASVIADAIECD